RVKLQADRLSHDWTAISTESGLELAAVPDSRLALSPADFAQVWPDANIGDNPIFTLPPDVNSRAVVVRAVASMPHAEQRTDWSLSSAQAQATYTAHLTGLPPARYEHRLALPSRVNVNRVNVVQAGHAAAVRWK